MAYLQERKKKSLCLLGNDLIFQHLKNCQGMLEISWTEPGIEAKTSKHVCAFSVASYLYSFPINTFFQHF